MGAALLALDRLSGPASEREAPERRLRESVAQPR
jgi:hypothetical protein